MAHENEWYFCLEHHQVEPWDGCRAADRLGPYPDKETAAHALEIAEQRNKAADDYDESQRRGSSRARRPRVCATSTLLIARACTIDGGTRGGRSGTSPRPWWPWMSMPGR